MLLNRICVFQDSLGDLMSNCEAEQYQLTPDHACIHRFLKVEAEIVPVNWKRRFFPKVLALGKDLLLWYRLSVGTMVSRSTSQVTFCSFPHIYLLFFSLLLTLSHSLLSKNLVPNYITLLRVTGHFEANCVSKSIIVITISIHLQMFHSRLDLICTLLQPSTHLLCVYFGVKWEPLGSVGECHLRRGTPEGGSPGCFSHRQMTRYN